MTVLLPETHKISLDLVSKKKSYPLSLETSDSENRELASALDIQAVNRLKLNGKVKIRRNGSYLLTVDLEADLTRTCVVTLEQIPEHLSITIERSILETGPDSQSAPDEDEFVELEELDQDEPIIAEKGTFDLLWVVYETIALEMSAYPRTEGTDPSMSDGFVQSSEDEDNPFAVLKQLKEN